MVTIIKNADLYTPESVGVKDILLVNGKIVAIDTKIELSGIDFTVIDAMGMHVCPGFIDQHVHITGGGGQDGFASFIGEVHVDELISVGTTTVLGMLGTDGFVKELSSLYSKAKSLDDQGITAYMLTSYYGLPVKTITTSIAEDMIYIDKVIGCKLAMSDDRSSFPSQDAILKIINQVRLGGFTSGKRGILHIHIGALESKIETLLAIASQYKTLIPYISPTHTIRTEDLFNQSIEFAKMGGMIDISTGGTKFTDPYKAVSYALEKGTPLENMTFSSDGRGGVKRIDPITGVHTYTPAPLNLNYLEMVKLVTSNTLSLSDALKLITTNPAKNLAIKNKGKIEIGYDADFVFLDSDYSIRRVIAKGKTMLCKE